MIENLFKRMAFLLKPQEMAPAPKEASRRSKLMQKAKKKKFGAMGEGKPRMMGSC